MHPKIHIAIFYANNYEGSVFMTKKSKHLTLDDRIYIESSLNSSIPIHQIAKTLGKQDSSIVREILRNRYKILHKSYIVYECTHRHNCDAMHQCADDTCKRICQGCIRVCGTDMCRDFVPVQCNKTLKSPFVCNGCSQFTNRDCNFPRYKYSAKKAQIDTTNRYKESRCGVSLSESEMKELDELVSPLILNGQSIESIYLSHAEEIPCSMRTLYNYVEKCYLTARNIDLPLKVRYKKRYNHNRKKLDQGFVIGHRYADFMEYIKENPDVSIVEMDTVIGKQGGKVIFTLMFRNSHLMLAFLLPDKSQDSVLTAINTVCDGIGIDKFRKIFGVILTDRGTEFSNPYAIEHNEEGEQRTKVFYCDPYCSWQKGMIEKNHELIRRIIPQGKSFDNLSQADVTLMMNHINNYPRPALNGAAPFELAKILTGTELLKLMRYHKKHPDEIVLKPLLVSDIRHNLL